MNPFKLSALIMVLFASQVLGAGSPVTQKNFNIAAQPVESALLEFSKQADMQVQVGDVSLDGYMTQGVKGMLDVATALQTLLRDTGLKADAAGHVVTITSIAGPLSGIAMQPLVKQTTIAMAVLEDAPQSVEDAPKTGANQIQEIVVTAQKRAERAIDVPMSVTALSGEKLAAAGITNARDLSYAVPGLSVAETGPGRQTIVIRGIGSTRGSSSLTGVYLDEMPVTGTQDGFIATYPDLRTIDLDRVEVLKGPQGTLFGEGAAGGVIRFLTNDPDLSGAGGGISTRLYNTADGDWSEELGGIVNIPIVEGVFGVRAAAVYENVSGWIDQPSIGREDINDSEVKHVRVKALYAPAPGLRIKGLVEIHSNEGGGTNIVNQEPRGDSNFIQAFSPDKPTDFTDNYNMFNLTVTYDFGFAELLSSSSYAKLYGTQNFTQFVDGQPQPWLQIYGNVRQDSAIESQEFRLTSANKGPFDWTLGATYKDADLVAPTGDGTFAIISGGATVLSRLGAGIRPATQSKSWATFANVSYRFAGRFEAGGGLRYFHDQRGVFDETLPNTTALSDTFEKVTFRTYLKYRASENVNLYVNAASGFRSGGFNAITQIPLGAPPSYGTEETMFYEAGAKMSLLDGRVRLDAAFFYGDYLGMQETSLLPSPVNGSPIQFTTNNQDAELKGVEWDFAWRAADSLTLTLSGDVTDTEIVKVDTASGRLPFLIGDPINLVPKYSASAGADYRFQWAGAVPGFFLLNLDRKGKSYRTDRANTLLIVRQGVAPEVSFLNASLGADLKGWQWSLFGRNLLDEDRAINPASTGWTAQARPRTFGVTIGKSF